MNDRELLELAARAAGREVWFDHLGRCCEMGYSVEWNPLIYDGDALGLAVKLQLTVRVWVSAVIVEDNNGNRLAHEDTGCRAQEYEHEATRRAIVRAAAAIGEVMK